jgi:hypothetical protein
MSCVKPCSICSSPPAVSAAVNRQLEQKIRMRDIAAAAGFSKSAVHRHSQKCVPRQVMAQHKAGKFDPQTMLSWYLWPNGDLTRQAIPYGFRGGVRDKPGPRDLIFKIKYEALPPPKPPKPVAVTPQEEKTPETDPSTI